MLICSTCGCQGLLILTISDIVIRLRSKSYLVIAEVVLILLLIPISVASQGNDVSIDTHGSIVNPPPSPRTPSVQGEVFWISCDWLMDSNNNPNSVAQRIATAKQTYGNPTMLAVANFGTRHTITSTLSQQVIDLFHSVGITVFQYVQSGYGSMSDYVTVAEIKAMVDAQLSLGSSVDGFFVDEAASFWSKNGKEAQYNFYKEISDYMRSKGKLIVFNPGTWQAGPDFLNLCDICCVEHWWRYLQDNPNFSSYQFFGISDGWAGVYYPWTDGVSKDPWVDPDAPHVATWQQAVDETKEAWSLGVKHFMGRLGWIEGPLPSEFEIYLEQLTLT